MPHLAESNTDYRGPDQAESEGNCTTYSWARDHSFNILSNNLGGFDPCCKNMPEAKLKSFRLILLAGEISRQLKNTWGGAQL